MCVFCGIVSGREPASVVYSDAAVIAFMDLHPINAGHLLVVPLGCPALSGQRIWTYFMPRAAGSGTRCGLPEESGTRVLNGDESDCTGAQCIVQCPRVLS